MYYVPIIKLKSAEIRLAKYVKDYICNDNIIPFFELIYPLDNKRKNTRLDEFISQTGCPCFFLGIPHNPSVIKTDDGSKYITQKNNTLDIYYEEALKLFDVPGAIPVFYIYRDKDIEYAERFIKTAQNRRKMVAIICPIDYAVQINQSLLTEKTTLMVDIGKDTVNSKRVSLKTIMTGSSCQLVLIRLNREDTFRNIDIEHEKEVPLLQDLSNEIYSSKKFLNFKINGFGDYCGFKNVATTKGGGGNQDKLFPAWAMYRRSSPRPYYYGIRSNKPVSNGGFENLASLTLEISKKLGEHENSPIYQIINNEKMGIYGPWNVLTEWNYIYQMSEYDSWSEINTLD